MVKQKFGKMKLSSGAQELNSPLKMAEKRAKILKNCYYSAPQ